MIWNIQNKYGKKRFHKHDINKRDKTILKDDNPTFILDGTRWYICRECKKYFTETGIFRHMRLKHEAPKN